MSPHCELCHVAMNRKRHPNGRLEKATTFRAKRFCSDRCRMVGLLRLRRAQRRQWARLTRKYVAA
jgi:hypothetical protein